MYAACFFKYIQPVVFDLHWDHSPFKADSYGNPIESIRFWSGRRNRYLSRESKNRLLCEIGCGDRAWDRARVVCLFARGFQQLLSLRQRRLHRYACSRAEYPSFGPGRNTPNFSCLIVVWRRRDLPTCFTWCFFQPSIRVQHDDLLLLRLLSCST